MLFRKKIERSCTYCAHGAMLEEDKVLCSKHGIRNPEQTCMRFRYDATKRIPKKARALDFSKYDKEDYSL